MGRQRGGYPGVNDDLPDTQAAAHNADGGAARQEIKHHLGGDRLRVAGYALGHDAVVGGGDDNRLAANGRAFRAVDSRQPDRQILQPPQTAGGLGQDRLPFRGAAHRIGVRAADTLHGLGYSYRAGNHNAAPPHQVIKGMGITGPGRSAILGGGRWRDPAAPRFQRRKRGAGWRG